MEGGFAVLMKTLVSLLLDVFPWAGERKDSLSKNRNQTSDDDCRLTTVCGGLALNDPTNSFIPASILIVANRDRTRHSVPQDRKLEYAERHMTFVVGC